MSAVLDSPPKARPRPALAVVKPSAAQLALTAVIVFGPLAGIVAGSFMLFRKQATLADLSIAIVLYAVTGHGLSAGFHRMCTHRAFRATRLTKALLVIAGSMAFEGGVLSWAANHRRHHAYTDVEGDPHSPHLSGQTIKGQLRGIAHAHLGWLFAPPPQERARWIPDLCADRDLATIDRLFPLWCVLSLGLPTLLGFAIAGSAAGAVGGFVWGGLVRVCVLQQATFAVNSACHIWGRQPFATRSTDEARNFAPLAVFAMGDNWHNLHHSLPRLARHGVLRHQWDSTARLIWLLEKASLVSEVRWPDAAVLAERRRGKDAEAPDASPPEGKYAVASRSA